MNRLKIEYAVNQNQHVVNPRTANKDDTYFCPHFAHERDIKCGESYEHATAKASMRKACFS